MAIKIDLAKAYDRVESGVLLNLLDRLEFGDHLCDLVRVCISSTRFSILINGLPFGFFPSEQGLRQGDPMSPLCSQLSRMSFLGYLQELKRRED